MGDIIPAIGITLVVVGILWLYGIGFSKGWQVAIACILIPFTLVILIVDEQGQRAWGLIALGVALLVGPYILSGMLSGY